ncbi:M23 family metallopeptidase [Actinotalea sp. AC32]|nr:M23 family metallopeptidase [Actinotalea sp. AC32]
MPARPLPTALVAATLTTLLGLQAAVGADRAPASAVPASPAVVRVPVDGTARVLRLFDPPAQRWSRGHRGVDVETGWGGLVLAPADGTVAFVGRVVDRGVVSIDHAGGLRSSLEPVAATVATGDVVAAGDVIGVVEERSAHCPGPCLHWGVRRGGTYVDPLGLLAGARDVRLLPRR